MPVLLLPPRYTSDSIALWEAASRLGWSVRRLYGWKVPEEMAGERVVVYGEIFFTGLVAVQLSLALLEPPLDWLVTLPERFRRRQTGPATLPERLLRHQIGMATIATLGDIPFPAFVKPADGKSFPPAVHQEPGSIPMTDILPGETLVIWSQPVIWELEIRAFILDREVRTLSLYARDGLYNDDGASGEELAAASAFLAELLADSSVVLPPAVVVDVGVIRGTGWSVVEANPCWSAGIYDCDPEQVLRVIERACIPRAEVGEHERRWVRGR